MSISWHTYLLGLHLNITKVRLLSNMDYSLLDQLEHGEKTDNKINLIFFVLPRKCLEAHTELALDALRQRAYHIFEADDLLDNN